MIVSQLLQGLGITEDQLQTNERIVEDGQG